MYDIIFDIIGHEYVSNYSGDQQYIYYICAVLISMFSLILADSVRFVFRAFLGRRK